MTHIPLELVFILGPVFATVVVLTLLESYGVHVSRSAKQDEIYFNRNANWPLPAQEHVVRAKRLAARIALARSVHS